MMNKFIFSVILIMLLIPLSSLAGQRLFILSGQSNMVMMDPTVVFIPLIEEHYGTENCIFVKDAEGGKSISNWDYGAWLWVRLTDKIIKSTTGHEIDTVTFIWMQGEADASFTGSSVYKNKLINLFTRVSNLFPTAKISYVVGRIDDWSLSANNPYWEKIRSIQQYSDSMFDRYEMVNTDDLNGVTNDIHMVGNYDVLAKRFADAAIKIENEKKRISLSLWVAMNIAVRGVKK